LIGMFRRSGSMMTLPTNFWLTSPIAVSARSIVVDGAIDTSSCGEVYSRKARRSAWLLVPCAHAPSVQRTSAIAAMRSTLFMLSSVLLVL
jgi:hypothetical protein